MLDWIVRDTLDFIAGGRYAIPCERSSMVEHQLPKLTVRVRFPSLALACQERFSALASPRFPFSYDVRSHTCVYSLVGVKTRHNARRFRPSSGG